MDDLMGFSGGETKYMVNPRLGEPPVPTQRNSTFQGCCLGRTSALPLLLAALGATDLLGAESAQRGLGRVSLRTPHTF